MSGTAIYLGPIGFPLQQSLPTEAAMLGIPGSASISPQSARHSPPRMPPYSGQGQTTRNREKVIIDKDSEIDTDTVPDTVTDTVPDLDTDTGTGTNRNLSLIHI